MWKFHFAMHKMYSCKNRDEKLKSGKLGKIPYEWKTAATSLKNTLGILPSAQVSVHNLIVGSVRFTQGQLFRTYSLIIICSPASSKIVRDENHFKSNDRASARSRPTLKFYLNEYIPLKRDAQRISRKRRAKISRWKRWNIIEISLTVLYIKMYIALIDRNITNYI